MPSAELAARRATFRTLHANGCFVIPNPWDRGSARALATLGFRALATSSAGLAFSRALPDSPDALGVDAVVNHVEDLVGATELPVNVDFQSGYAAEPEGLAANVGRCIEAGAAGLSIEDASGNPASPLFDLERAVERVRAARGAIDASGAGVVLTARAECFLVGAPDPLAESIRRLEAYAAAGADVLYAPGARDPAQIAAIVEAAAPRPVNVLATADLGLRLSDLANLGVRRVSVGSGLARVAWGAFLRAAGQIAEEGDFSSLDEAARMDAMNGLFAP